MEAITLTTVRTVFLGSPDASVEVFLVCPLVQEYISWRYLSCRLIFLVGPVRGSMFSRRGLDGIEGSYGIDAANHLY